MPAVLPRAPVMPWYRPAMRDVLAVASTALFGFALVAPAVLHGAIIDQELKGAIVLQWGLVMGYYFGTSKSSVAKDGTIASMAANPTVIDAGMPPPAPPAP